MNTTCMTRVATKLISSTVNSGKCYSKYANHPGKILRSELTSNFITKLCALFDEVEEIFIERFLAKLKILATVEKKLKIYFYK